MGPVVDHRGGHAEHPRADDQRHAEETARLVIAGKPRSYVGGALELAPAFLDALRLLAAERAMAAVLERRCLVLEAALNRLDPVRRAASRGDDDPNQVDARSEPRDVEAGLRDPA